MGPIACGGAPSLSGVRALLRGLWEAETWSLRGMLMAGAFASLAVTLGSVAIGRASRNSIAGGLAGCAVLFILALGAQRLAERRGTPEREHQRREEWAHGFDRWPRRKQIAYLGVAITFAVTMLVLSVRAAF